MNIEELRGIFSAAGLNSRVARDEVILQICTNCGNEKWNLECSPSKGVFYCWVCQKGGRLSSLLRSLTGQNYYIPVTKGEEKDKVLPPTASAKFKSKKVSEVESAGIYLGKRGITLRIAEQYGIVVCVEEGHRLEGRICIPVHAWWSGELSGWIGRTYTGKQPKYISTMTEKIITGWKYRDRTIPIVVVEGPMDGISVHQAGYQAAVLAGTGSGGIDYWLNEVGSRTPVVIMLDGDATAKSDTLLQKILPFGVQVVQVRLGLGEDPASLGPEAIGGLVQQALRSPPTTSS